MKYRNRIMSGLGLAALLVYVANASWIAGPPDRELTILSHRGVHHVFHTEGLTNDSCTAERIFSPSHELIENTLPAFEAAITAGAEMIELDVHPTTDGEFVVFHDWTLDCRTNGNGRTRDHDLATLKALDIGFGYTSDGGETYPLRGQAPGLMPSLSEVLSAFSDIHIAINIKSRSTAEARALLTYIPEAEWKRLSFIGHSDPLDEIANSRPKAILTSRPQAKTCFKNYLLWGWSGYVPKACHNSHVPVPANYRRLLWGWPHRFERRLIKVGSRSMLIGPYHGGPSLGIDSPDDLEVVPLDYTGIIFTNRAEIIGPALRQGREKD